MREHADSRGQRMVAVAAVSGAVEKRLAETHRPPIHAVAHLCEAGLKTGGYELLARPV